MEDFNDKMMAYCRKCVLFEGCGGKHASVYSIYPDKEGFQISYKCGMENAPKPFFHIASDHNPYQSL